MRSEKDALIAEFPELGNHDLTMQKEVFAHFGLAFMKFGLVKHSMVNVITFHRVGEGIRNKLIRSQSDWEQSFDDGYAEAIGLTFGNQIKRIATIPEFSDLAAQFSEAKRLRNYFAHYFMREEAGHFGTDEGCWLLLTKIAEVRRVTLQLEEDLKPRFENMRVRYQLPKPTDEQMDVLLSQYRNEHAEAIRDGSAKVGWDKDAL